MTLKIMPGGWDRRHVKQSLPPGVKRLRSYSFAAASILAAFDTALIALRLAPPVIPDLPLAFGIASLFTLPGAMLLITLLSSYATNLPAARVGFIATLLVSFMVAAVCIEIAVLAPGGRTLSVFRLGGIAVVSLALAILAGLVTSAALRHSGGEPLGPGMSGAPHI